MTRVDFAFGAADRLRMACEVTRKQYLAGRRLLVYTQDASRLAKFDRLLWGFDATAFIPHVAVADPLAPTTPVLLVGNADELAQAAALFDKSATPAEGDASAWLLNLDLYCPPAPERFARILEIVSNHTEDKNAARERWRQYQASGLSLHAHDVSGHQPRG
ncbi:DNA polymerase III subunit chi [Pusillimonas sp. TS35]|uniref:DNA polymerase III subunit chi n=1 Tax=Paracandidimonas lactea TaxID=2895524 RepID=UPI001370DCEB|nr:DNA polymerase III subunit chi [Paracandidimonas lactea]MYN13724.1 DNA polymerase III subunit chi [Pusillimonas sp. TS35]